MAMGLGLRGSSWTPLLLLRSPATAAAGAAAQRARCRAVCGSSRGGPGSWAAMAGGQDRRGWERPAALLEGFGSWVGPAPRPVPRGLGSREWSACRANNKWFGGEREPEEEAVPDEFPQDGAWPVLKRWDIPWDGKVTSIGMVTWLVSFLLTGLFISVLAAQIGIGRRQFLSPDDQAVYVFIHQLAQTIAGLAVVNSTVTPYKPLSPDLFSIEWTSPFDLRRGWIIWGTIGVLCSCAAVVGASYITFTINGQPLPRDETDALKQLMPIIGATPLSTAALIAVTGVLAPILEETIFRGFLMTSLTKWMPTPAAVVLSAFGFAWAHLTPGEFPQLLALGIILGFTYAQTRNLVTPIVIHSIWNSGVVVLLTVLQLQGYDIKDLI